MRRRIPDELARLAEDVDELEARARALAREMEASVAQTPAPWKDKRKNPYAPRRNSAGRPVEPVTDPPKYVRDRRVPPELLKRKVVASGRWTTEALRAWRTAWRLTQKELAVAMGVGKSSLNRLETGRVPFSRSWVRLLDAECQRIENEMLTQMRAHRVRKLVGSPSLDEQFKPRRYADQRRFLPGKLVPRDANGVPIR